MLSQGPLDHGLAHSELYAPAYVHTPAGAAASPSNIDSLMIRGEGQSPTNS